ncbi:hypothetical protein GCM10010174_65850 [Kutzneria viridogrisea]|uniref:Uncharacterized protein n=2 Tax=Kutzneria TaxID=43356 RepID=A0ABR6BY87_9PSEU|nr:hypothetical protein [Kutzneria albida]AHH97152.1 putative secreted protein [Kutzneria albida DSM 43870]MBA8931877.1 hypothetical protein [Kutzneria viridogrisea]
MRKTFAALLLAGLGLLGCAGSAQAAGGPGRPITLPGYQGATATGTVKLDGNPGNGIVLAELTLTSTRAQGCFFVEAVPGGNYPPNRSESQCGVGSKAIKVSSWPLVFSQPFRICLNDYDHCGASAK